MADLPYSEKVVIITGGSSGIGKGCAQEFIRAGSHLVICCNNQAEGEAVVSSLNEVAQAQGSGSAIFIYCDVRETEDIRLLIEKAIAHHGRIDCLINNAGWHPPHKPIDDFSVEEFRELLNLNLVSIFSASKFALPYLRQTQGNIINMSSLVATIGQHHATTYVATKGAITAFTKALAVDEAPHGVRVNSVSPGNVYTPLWQEAIDQASDPEEYRSRGEAAQLLGRMGQIEEVGRLCLFIASQATFTTGVDHVISGGAELGYAQKSRNGHLESHYGLIEAGVGAQASLPAKVE
ncbi:MAG TPA: SDR family oxidoreductase [Pyrinomonadaceae bacterium]|nr:SDR family oxidoreductase [Pyrinomonadaceae bacterium]